MYHSGLRGFVALVTIILVSAGCGNIEVASTTPEGTCESDSDCITDTSCEVGVCNKSKGLCAYTVANGKCLVEGQCYESGDPQPSLPCKVCRPDLDQQSFLNKTCAEGQICEPTNGECVGDSPEKCGNGNKEPGEACDDGNTAPGDGCDAACAVESGWVCETVGAACTDIDECAQGPNPCDVNATCTNSEGAYSCACNEGFEGDGTTCTPTDACAADPAPCDANATCTSGDTGATCACNEGWEGDGVTCTDVNECETLADACGANATCTNEEGSYACACAEGFEADDDGACVDIDECATAAVDCEENASCVNTEGGYECACNPGFIFDGDKSCVDIDECVQDPAPCDENATCTNSEGSHACTCNVNEGWEGDGLSCTKIDYCAAVPAPCDANASCTNGETEAICVCDEGWFGDGLSCTDVDECEQYIDGLNLTFDDEFTAVLGWKIKQLHEIPPKLTWQDNMLASVVISQKGPLEFLVVSPGVMDLKSDATVAFDFALKVPVEWIQIDWRTCADPLGSGECTAAIINQDYDSDVLTAITLVDAVAADDIAQGKMIPYAFKLPQATPGFLVVHLATFLDEDQAPNTIWTLDNLKVFSPTTPCDDNATCTNVGGGYACACNDGWSGDGHTCADVDECAADGDLCDANATCANTQGGFSCACNKGFEGNGFTCGCPEDYELGPEGDTCEHKAYVGVYTIGDGPQYIFDPPTYTCLEACALIFGGDAEQYACSTTSEKITHTAYYSGWGVDTYCDDPQPEDWKLGETYNCGGLGCAYSAYVIDHCKQIQNHCFLAKPDECTNYQSLTEANRHESYLNPPESAPLCDSQLSGWFRFEGDAGVQMATEAPPIYSCQTNAPGWLQTDHPSNLYQTLDANACFAWEASDCEWSHPVQVTHCGDYYVYGWDGTGNCSLRYCGAD